MPSLLSWFLPRTLVVETSKINGQITVVAFQGKVRVYINGTEQSGPWVEKIWKRALPPLSAKNTLVLGLGAGTVIKVLQKKYPSAKITGVEIDPIMINLGRKYFGLGDLSNLSILMEDARKLVKDITKEKRRFDLVLVDLYLGNNYPKSFESNAFLQRLSQIVSKSGLVVFNRLADKNSRFEAEKFVDKLTKVFKIQETVKVDFNTLVFCSRKESTSSGFRGLP